MTFDLTISVFNENSIMDRQKLYHKAEQWCNRSGHGCKVQRCMRNPNSGDKCGKILSEFRECVKKRIEYLQNEKK